VLNLEIVRRLHRLINKLNLRYHKKIAIIRITNMKINKTIIKILRILINKTNNRIMMNKDKAITIKTDNQIVVIIKTVMVIITEREIKRLMIKKKRSIPR
jgi:hypothetical protein